MIDVADRGFNYGDGVFETVLVADGEAVWWEAHVVRMRLGCERLGIRFPADELAAGVRGELVEPLPRGSGSTGSPRTVSAFRTPATVRTANGGRSVLKIVVTRGIGGRGYAPPRDATPSVVVTTHEAPKPKRTAALRWCELRLSQQPALAGLKHLNRLENVLARAEWDDPAVDEGLLRDGDERVVCATAANLFVVRGDRLLTPKLHRCGVAGIARGWVMAQAPVEEVDLSPDEVEAADELFLTSSLRGILPVARLGRRTWNTGPMTRRLQQRLWAEVPALEPAA